LQLAFPMSGEYRRPMPDSRLSPVSDSDRARIVDTLVLAFAADEVERWMYPDARSYLAHFPAFIEAFGGRAFEHETVWGTEDLRAVALWLPPGAEPDGDALLAVVAETVAPEKLDDLYAVVGQMAEVHPTYPHWYLAWLGVDPASQGRGLGGELLGRCLQVVDESRLPAFLETSNPRSIPLYERHGFELVAEAREGGCPPVAGMLRAAR
jgi:ribosomal protein S18 acetylase RimI-like enzyme